MRIVVEMSCAGLRLARRSDRRCSNDPQRGVGQDQTPLGIATTSRLGTTRTLVLPRKQAQLRFLDLQGANSFAVRTALACIRWDSLRTWPDVAGVVALKNGSADTNGHRAIRPCDRVGSFRYFRAGDRWEWSDTVAAMHGYPPGAVEPTTALVMSHKHPDDAAKVSLLIEAMAGRGQPFSSRHRIIDRTGRIRHVLVIGEQLCDDGAVVGSEGFYVDLSDLGQDLSVDAAIADFTEHRAQIEQAKGILMAVYGIPPSTHSTFWCGAHRRPTPNCACWSSRSSPTSPPALICPRPSERLPTTCCSPRTSGWVNR